MDATTRDLLMAQDGDSEAFTRVVRATQDDLRRFCQWLSSPGDGLDDVVQETYLRAFRKINTFRGEASATTWLLSIARRVCLDHSAKSRGYASNEGAHLGDRFVSPEDQRLVDTKVSIVQLPDVFREAFVLVRVMGFSYEETGHILLVPTGTVQSRVARARQILINEHLADLQTREVS